MMVLDVLQEGVVTGAVYLGTPLFWVLHAGALYAGLRFRWWAAPLVSVAGTAVIHALIESERYAFSLFSYLRDEWLLVAAIVSIHGVAAGALVGLANFYRRARERDDSPRPPA